MPLLTVGMDYRTRRASESVVRHQFNFNAHPHSGGKAGQHCKRRVKRAAFDGADGGLGHTGHPGQMRLADMMGLAVMPHGCDRLAVERRVTFTGFVFQWWHLLQLIKCVVGSFCFSRGVQIKRLRGCHIGLRLFHFVRSISRANLLLPVLLSLR